MHGSFPGKDNDPNGNVVDYLYVNYVDEYKDFLIFHLSNGEHLQVKVTII